MLEAPSMTKIKLFFCSPATTCIHWNSHSQTATK